MRRQHAVRFVFDDEPYVIGFVELWDPGYPHEIYVRTRDILDLITTFDAYGVECPDGSDAMVTELIGAAYMHLRGDGDAVPYGWDMEVDSFNVSAG